MYQPTETPSTAMDCRVCLQTPEQPLEIFAPLADVASVLAKHLWFKPLPDDGKSHVICRHCWDRICEFHRFYLAVEAMHRDLRTVDVKTEWQPTVIATSSCRLDALPSGQPDDGENELVALLPLALESVDVRSPLYEPEVLPRRLITAEAIDVAAATSTTTPHSDADTRRTPTSEVSCSTTHSGSCATNGDDAAASEDAESGSLKRRTIRQRLLPRQKTLKPTEVDAIIRKHIPMGCDLCPFVGESFADMQRHFRLQHPDQKAYVMCCDRKLTKRFGLLQHAQRHEDPEFFKCVDCQKVFSNGNILLAHRLALHPPEDILRFQCDQCPKRFARQHLLELHKPSHIPPHEHSFLCKTCTVPKAFASEHLLNVHISQRHRKAANVCHVCAKVIRDDAAYRKHVRLHFEDSGPRVKCPLPGCDRWLKDEENLAIHLRRHNDEGRVYTCDTCGKQCKNRRALTCHLNYSHSNRVFTCEVCQKSFKRAITLKEHMSQHTGEALYQCPFCARSFNSNANMHSHKKKMHPLEWDLWRRTKRSGSHSKVETRRLVLDAVADRIKLIAADAIELG